MDQEKTLKQTQSQRAREGKEKEREKIITKEHVYSFMKTKGFAFGLAFLWNDMFKN